MASRRWLPLILALSGPIQAAQGPSTPVPGDRALIVVGLPGDPEHEALFRSTVGAWRAWLTGPVGFPASGVRVLGGETPATREAIAHEAESLRSGAAAGHRAWVFVLGHANAEGGHAFLHLPGPDLREDEFAGLFRGIPAREQVFWMTTAGSGRFLPTLSSPGRIVLAATEAEGETNETEFPQALAGVGQLPPAKLDRDRDGKVSVFEVFLATVDAVNSRYAADKRAPTEHAQLDDNGDGVGTEPGPANSDGALASKTFLPTTPATPPTNPPARSDHGTRPAVPPAD